MKRQTARSFVVICTTASVKLASTLQVSLLLRLQLSIAVRPVSSVLRNERRTVLLIEHTFDETGREKFVGAVEKRVLSLKLGFHFMIAINL